jgi:hypothetical protein
VSTTTDLHRTNDNSTGSVGIGDSLHVIATVGGLDTDGGCLS